MLLHAATALGYIQCLVRCMGPQGQLTIMATSVWHRLPWPDEAGSLLAGTALGTSRQLLPDRSSVM